MRRLTALLAAALLLAAAPALAMPYVPQTVGTYDTLYRNLTASRCRGCHADTQAAHHASGFGCADCHPDPLTPVGECTACHGQEEVRTPTLTLRRGHHVTSDAAAGQCSTCHSPLLVADYGAVAPPEGPLSATTPCPENCRTCHKGTTAVSPPVAALDGEGPSNLHHNPQGDVVTAFKCDYCHDPALPHYDQRQIRVCERCHPSTLLHSIHPADACQGCHTALSRLVYINRAYTTDAAGNPSSRFSPGEPILYHVSYDVVGAPACPYVVRAIITAFGKDVASKVTRLPGRGYEAILGGQVPAKLAPGATRRIVYKLRLRHAGVVLSADRAVSDILVVSP
jgi:hypothetical protein